MTASKWKHMLRRKPLWGLAGIFLLMTTVFFCLPVAKFADNYSLVLEDRHGQLLGARIALDEQWRFPVHPDHDTLSDRYMEAVLSFEDKRFYKHIGVDPLALIRALIQNVKAGKIISGGSTITMQVISLYRGKKADTVWEKMWEGLLALRLEASASKAEIFNLYAGHAPYGGNTVGYGAATWRYFGKHRKELTWSEAALLAVLPNNPSMIHLARNRKELLEKRNMLLTKLCATGWFGDDNLELYMEEPLPDAPVMIPNVAPHLLGSMKKLTGENYLLSSVDFALQTRVNDVMTMYGIGLKANQVHNAAVLVAEVKTGRVLAYVGNIPGTGTAHSEQVDVIQASRSTGSLLKPFLTMFALEEGIVTPTSLLSDHPINIDGFRPDNFTYDYEGSVPLVSALRQSLNIPFVLLLRQYNISRALHRMRTLGLHGLNRTANHYGLSLIVGGGESSLFELCGSYASAARILSGYTTNSGTYAKTDVRALSVAMQQVLSSESRLKGVSAVSAGAVWQTFEMLSEIKRPGRFESWREIVNGRKVAWKTGTSIGFRDAWAIGVTPEYIVGVWIGNADGEGRPGVIGLESAAPLMFETFELLPGSSWFDVPYDDLHSGVVCANSGYAPNPNCPADTVYMSNNIDRLPLCTYDRTVHLDATGRYQVNAGCYDTYAMKKTSFFVLPAVEQFYFVRKHPAYKPVPPLKPGCESIEKQGMMQFVYPVGVSRIFLPKAIGGNLNPVTLEVAHRDPEAKVFWHIDNQYLTATVGEHTLSSVLPPGKHIITCIDQQGNRISTAFEVIHSEYETE